MVEQDWLVARVARAMLDDTPDWTGENWDEEADVVRPKTVREFLAGTYIASDTEVIAQAAAKAAIEATGITALEAEVARLRQWLNRIAEADAVVVTGPGKVEFPEYHPRKWARRALNEGTGA